MNLKLTDAEVELIVRSLGFREGHMKQMAEHYTDRQGYLDYAAEHHELAQRIEEQRFPKKGKEDGRR